MPNYYTIGSRILVPYPYATDDLALNAQHVESIGSGISIKEDHLNIQQIIEAMKKTDWTFPKQKTSPETIMANYIEKHCL